MSSVLELVQAAADELSLERPQTVIGNTDSNEAQKLFRHLTRSCRRFGKRNDWSFLRAEYTFTTTATAEQTGHTFPSDFHRWIEESFWNRTSRTRVNGPLTSAEYQERLAQVSTSPFDWFYKRGSSLFFHPVPGASETCAYEYISKYIGTDTAGTTARLAFTVDTDIPYWDDELLIASMVWRYRKAEGQDYAEEFREAELLYADEWKMDGGRRRLNLSGGPRVHQPQPPVVPDTLNI